MNLNFLQLLMEKTGFPQEAQEAYRAAAGQIDPEEMAGTISFYYENDFDTQLTAPLIDEMAAHSGVSVYTVWGLFLALAAEKAYQAYQEAGIADQVFFDTFSDLRCKTLECKENKGVWGTFVAFWYPIFYRLDIFKLGRLEYEVISYRGPAVTLGGHRVNPGDQVLNIHIPSSGEPFDAAARLASYKLAYEFFQDRLKGGPAVFVCHSWLLYPGYREALPEGSNIVSFMDDFAILEAEDSSFDDAWRVFGPEAEKAPAELPEKTRMQRAFKKHLLAGGKTGCAQGAFLFDGEKLIKS